MSDLSVQDNIRTNILTDPIYAEAIERCVQKLAGADPESDGKGSFGNAIVSCHQDIQTATRTYQEQHPEVVRLEDVHDLGMTADVGYYDVSRPLMEEITAAIEKHGGITPALETQFRTYATTYAMADYARSEVCSGSLPAEISLRYEQMNPGSSPNCPQLLTQMKDIDYIVTSKDPVIASGGMSLKRFWLENGLMMAGLGYSFQPGYPHSASTADVQAGLTFPVTALPLHLGVKTSLGIYLTSDRSFMPQGELKAFGLEFKPLKLLAGYQWAGASFYLTGGAWPTYYHLLRQGQSDQAFTENIFQNITSEIGIVAEKNIRNTGIVGEVGVRNDPYGVGGYAEVGIEF